MSGNREQRRQQDNNWLWSTATAVAGTAGLAAVAGGVYWLTQKLGSKENANTATPYPNPPVIHNNRTNSNNSSSTVSSHLTNIVQKLDILQGQTVARSRVSTVSKPTITNLNGLLSDIYTRFVIIADEDRAHYHKVFTDFFDRLHNAMKEVDPYYKKYCGNKQFAGSHYDGLPIKKVDEFPDKDIDIVIGLPLNFKQNPSNPDESDIVFEAKYPGFVQLKMGVQFQRLLMRDGVEWLTNKTAYEWKDDKNYLLRSKFIYWFKSVVDRALNKFGLNLEGKRFMYIEGVQYTIRLCGPEKGPAVTVIVENKSIGFKLDVDLVPALRFPEDRWPISRGYRSIPLGCNRDYWMVVPKPNKAVLFPNDSSRCWRLALHDQEKRLMHGTNNMRQALRLLKKFRDTQEMDKLASYYIKTLFFSEIADRNDISFWSKNSPAAIFKIMASKLHAALVKEEIPYFWNRSNNLISLVDRRVLNLYAEKVKNVIDAMDNTKDYKTVAKFFLTEPEYQGYVKLLE